MATTLPALPDTFKPKSFWEKKEGFFGLGILGAVGLAGFFGVLTFGPMILTFLGLMIAIIGKGAVLAVLCGLVGSVIWFLSQKKVRLVISLMFKSFARWFASWWVTVDPIGIMEGVIEKFKERLQTLAQRKGELRAQLNACKQQIIQNKKEADDALAAVSYAKSKGNALQLQVKSNEYGRLQESTEKLTATVARLEGLVKMVNKYYDASAATIEDLSNQVKISKRDSAVMKSAYSAMKAAEAILAGQGDEYELFNASLEYQADEANRMLSEIEEFVDSSQVIMQGIDMRNGVWQEKALAALNQFENTDSKLLGGEKRLLLEQQQTTAPTVIPAVVGTGDYEKFFSKS